MDVTINADQPIIERMAIMRRFGSVRGLRGVLIMLSIAVLYFAAARFGFLMAFATKQVTAVWPPTGIAFVAYVIFGFRIWPGVYLGAFAANAMSSESLLTAAGIAVGNTLAGIVGLYLMRRIVGAGNMLGRPSGILGLLLFGGMAGAVVSASNGVANLALGGIVPWSAYGSVWWVWWVGDTLGVMLIAPLLLSWLTRRESDIRRRLPELWSLAAALLVLCYLALSGEVLRNAALFRIEYSIFPILIWIALRFGQREVASAVVLVSAFAIWGAIHDRGPFAIGSFDQRLTLLDLFLAVTSVTGLTLGAVTAARRRAEAALQRAKDELERRVQLRTAELGAVNKSLAQKNEEVEAFVYIVSHDLRAPLVNLQGFSKELETSCRELEQVLGAASLPTAVQAPVQRIVKDDIPGALRYITASTAKFERLIDALLRLSRYGRQDFKATFVDSPRLVASTLDTLRQLILQKQAQLIVGELPPASGDLTAIGQVFANVIGNALKYLRPDRAGRIEIGGTVDGAMVHYWVRDNGAGIPAAVRRRLFQVFQRFHPELAPGEGMGLAIVKRIVERHGGQIWVDSEENVGTTIHFTLPSAALP